MISEEDDRSNVIPLFKELEGLKQALLQHGGGGGTSGGVTDDWKESVNRQLDQLHGDVRKLVAGGIGFALIVLTAIGGLYMRIDAKTEAVGEKVVKLQADQLALRGELTTTLARQDGKLDVLIERGGAKARK